MWEYLVNSPSTVSNYPESRVRVTLLKPLDVRFRGYLTTAHSPSMGIGEGPKNPASMSIYPKNILEWYPSRNTLGEAWLWANQRATWSSSLPGSLTTGGHLRPEYAGSTGSLQIETLLLRVSDRSITKWLDIQEMSPVGGCAICGWWFTIKVDGVPCILDDDDGWLSTACSGREGQASCGGLESRRRCSCRDVWLDCL